LLFALRTDGSNGMHLLKQQSRKPVYGQMKASARTERPFRDFSAKEIRDAGREAYERRDVAELHDAISELDTFRSTGEACEVSEELTELLDSLEPRSGERHEPAAQTCRKCGQSIHGQDIFYCETCSAVLLERIERDATRIADAAVALYVGRTAFPERRLLEHLFDSRRDRLSILHWADSLEEAEVFERSIFKLVGNTGKTDQDEPRMRGRFSRGHHAIYISWNSRSAPVGAEQRLEPFVTTLPGQRRWPVPTSTFQVDHLWSPLDTYQAKEVLNRFDDRETRYLERRRAHK
jgi:hypothetical protein